MAVALRLGLPLGAPHTCQCGAEVDACGLHGLVCKKAPSRIIRHQCFNDIVARSLTAAGVPITKEPVGLSRLDGKRPDGMTLIPYQAGKMLVWDVTVVSTLAESYVAAAAREAGEVAEQAAVRKCAKYAELPSTFSFLPIAMETLGPMNASAMEFFVELGSRIETNTGDNRQTKYLFQRLSVCIQRFNSALFRETFVAHEDPDE